MVVEVFHEIMEVFDVMGEDDDVHIPFAFTGGYPLDIRVMVEVMNQFLFFFSGEVLELEV